MTAKQKNEIKRAQARLDRAAKISNQTYRDLVDVFPPYSIGAASAIKSSAARAADDAERNAASFRVYADNALNSLRSQA